MNVNFAQLNPMATGTPALQTIELSAGGTTQSVAFSQVLQALLGLGMDPELAVLTAQGAPPETAMEATTQEDTGIPADPDAMLFPMQTLPVLPDMQAAPVPTTMPSSQPEPAQSAMPIRTAADTPLQPDETALPTETTTIETTQTQVREWVVENLRKEVTGFVEQFQKEMQVSRVVESEEPAAMTHTAQSYRNLQRILPGREAAETVAKPEVQAKTSETQTAQPTVGKSADIAIEPTLQSTSAPLVQEAIPREESEEPVRMEKKTTDRPETKAIVPSAAVQRTEAPEEVQPQKRATVIENDREIREKMMESIRECQDNGASKVKVQLHPKELGQLEIELKIREGRVEGEIKVMTQAAKEEITKLVAPIKEALQNNQVAVKEFSVTLMSSNAGGQTGSGQSGFQAPQDQQRSYVWQMPEDPLPDFQPQRNESTLDIFA